MAFLQNKRWDIQASRKHGLSTEQFPVSAYVGSSKNLKDLKDPRTPPTLFFAGVGELRCRGGHDRGAAARLILRTGERHGGSSRWTERTSARSGASQDLRQKDKVTNGEPTGVGRLSRR